MEKSNTNLFIQHNQTRPSESPLLLYQRRPAPTREVMYQHRNPLITFGDQTMGGVGSLSNAPATMVATGSGVGA